MNMISYLSRQFAYDLWANREVLAAMRAAGDADPRSLQLMSHIVAAEQLWLERLQERPQSVAVWPNDDLSHCEAKALEMGNRWTEYLAAETDDSLSRSIRYKNTRNEQFTSTVMDILTHVLMHAAYHRGQIASHMREKGMVPAYTDFIHGVRRGFVK
jgi:uncharacterized damage-inducible protein DinB